MYHRFQIWDGTLGLPNLLAKIRSGIPAHPGMLIPVDNRSCNVYVLNVLLMGERLRQYTIFAKRRNN